MTVAEEVFERVKTLPEPLARKVLDFAISIVSGGERAEWLDLMAAQESSLAVIWENDDDSVWDDL